MSGLFRAQLSTATGKRAVPRGSLRINWRHPCARSLEYLFVCNGSGMRDLVHDVWYPATGGSQASGALGIGWQSGGSGTRIMGPSGDAARIVGDYSRRPLTAIVCGKFATTASTTTAFANGYATGSGGWVIKAEQYANTGNVGFTGPGIGSDYNSGIATPTVDGSVIAVSLQQTGSLTTYLVNKTYATTANATIVNSGDQICVGATPRNSLFNDPLVSGDIVYWAAIYSRVLDRGEMMLWSDGPFGSIVIQGVQFPWFPPAAGVGTNPKGPLGNPFFGPFGGPI